MQGDSRSSEERTEHCAVRRSPRSGMAPSIDPSSARCRAALAGGAATSGPTPGAVRDCQQGSGQWARSTPQWPARGLGVAHVRVKTGTRPRIRDLHGGVGPRRALSRLSKPRRCHGTLHESHAMRLRPPRAKSSPVQRPDASGRAARGEASEMCGSPPQPPGRSLGCGSSDADARLRGARTALSALSESAAKG